MTLRPAHELFYSFTIVGRREPHQEGAVYCKHECRKGGHAHDLTHEVSAAFDTVDHEILLKRLQLSFGLSGNFLTWLASFLDGRSLCVVHGSSRSQWVPAPHSIPQGSVLASLLYIIYTSELGPLRILTVLCWVSCMLMMSRPTCTVCHLMPWLPFRQ